MFKYHAMKTQETGGIAPCILNLGIRFRDWPAARPSHFTPECFLGLQFDSVDEGSSIFRNVGN
jgi:hypothetical protein